VPRGVYKRDPANGKRFNAGRRPTCLCGVCKVCKARVINQRYRGNRRAAEERNRVVSDEELERRMNSMFEERGWV
jgi:hypothetical protein